MKALEVSGLSKGFGGVQAVDGLTFSVEEYETLGIIGPNGAGKTTLFNLISGLYRPDAGEVRFFGRRLDHVPTHRLARLGMSRTFQNLRLFNGLTVLQNLTAPILGMIKSSEPASRAAETNVVPQGRARQKSNQSVYAALMASNATLRRSRTPLRMNQAHKTGSSVKVTINEPTNAKIIVSAIGLNSVPEGPDST